MINFVNEFKSLLARDYNCLPEDFDKNENILTAPSESFGRNYCEYSRLFRMVTFGNSCVICADKVLHPFLREFIKSEYGHRLFEQNALFSLQGELTRFRYKLGGSHHYFLPKNQVELSGKFRLKWLFDKTDFMKFYGDKRFPNALCEHYSETRPDKIVVLAYDGENIMGMAGCSEDAPGWLQIGVDVIPEYRGRGVGTFLVNSLKNEILRRGEIPFYGTAVANIHSQNIAIKCGFKPAFAEIGAVGEGKTMDMKMSVSNEELFALTKKAFDNDEVAEFLCGENGYAIHGNRDIPTNIPTDFNRIVRNGIYKLYSETHDEKIIAEFCKAIENLNDTPTRVWCAYMACWNQILNEHAKYPAPFMMADEILLNKMRVNLQSNEMSLRNCRDWMGNNKDDGLWGYINYLDRILMEDCGMCLL